MPEPGTFECYFYTRADVAEDLYRNGLRIEAKLIATVALDALAAIWIHDFQVTMKDGSDIRLAEFVTKFGEDARASRIAVVLLAEDMLTHGPARLYDVAQRLLNTRAVGQDRVRPIEFRESPRAYLDKGWSELVTEEPCLANERALEELSVRYTYPALLYRLQRCAIAHAMSQGTRSSDFSGTEPDDEISYFPPYLVGGKTRPISLKIGLLAVTLWLRRGVTNYVRECDANGKRPADDFDPSATSLGMLAAKWKPVCK